MNTRQKVLHTVENTDQMRKIEAEILAGGKSYLEKKDSENRKVAKNCRNIDSKQSKKPRGGGTGALVHLVELLMFLICFTFQPRKGVSVIKRLANELKDPVEQNLPSNHLLPQKSETISSVKKFYVHEDIGRKSLGNRDAITVRCEDGKIKMHKRHIYHKSSNMNFCKCKNASKMPRKCKNEFLGGGLFCSRTLPRSHDLL